MFFLNQLERHRVSLCDIARARGMADIARGAGVTREVQRGSQALGKIGTGAAGWGRCGRRGGTQLQKAARRSRSRSPSVPDQALTVLVACLPSCAVKRCAMAIPIDVLEAQALSLPQADRSRLVDRLLASLGHDPEWEQAWSEEADRREARVADGKAQWVNGPEAVARIRAALK